MIPACAAIAAFGGALLGIPWLMMLGFGVVTIISELVSHVIHILIK